jgi:membrane fusion protein, multidrug efflux system
MKNTNKFLLMLALTTILAACNNQGGAPRQAPPPVNVTTQTVTFDYLPYFEEYPGVVKALQEVELRPQVSGYITGIHFKEGSQVKKGDKLYTIDQQQTEAVYQQAQANLAVQEANLDKAQKDAERYRELAKKDAIAKQQLDYAESSLIAAKKQVDAAKAAVKSAQTNVRYTNVVAPFNGTIGISAVRLGAAVSPGQTLLNTISSNDPMGLEVIIDQSAIMTFQELSKTQTDSTFQLEINGKPYAYFGKLTIIDRAVDQLTGTIKVRVEFPNGEGMLRPGMSAQLNVLSNASSKSIAVPFKSITEQLGEFYMYVVVADNKVSQRRIRIGKQVGKNIIVREGLQADEVIVIEGVQNLREGSSINIPAATPSAK